MTFRRILSAILGVSGALVGVALIVGAIWLLNENRDADGFHATEPHRFERESYAVVSGDFDQLTEVPSWFADLVTDPVDLRIAGTSARGAPLFVGIASTDDVDRYLSGVAHHEVTSLDLDGRSIDTVNYAGREGRQNPAPPGEMDFWVVSTEGEGRQSLEWPLQRGSWTAVVMNADASAGLNADLDFGAKISNIVAVAWGVIGFGLFSLLLGGYLVFRGVRTQPDLVVTPDAPAAPPVPPRPEATPRHAAYTTPRSEGQRMNELQASATDGRASSFFDWVNDHVRWITIGVIAITIAAVPLAMNRSEEDPNFDPSGEIYDTQTIVGERFVNSSPIERAVFIVEASNGGDALTRDVLFEFKQNSDALRSNADLTPDLAIQFRSELGEEVDGVFSLADKVDEALAGGLGAASDADVKLALADILGEGAVGSPLRDTLSQLATSRNGEVSGQDTVIWESPAFTATVVMDLTSFGGRDTESQGFGDISLEGEEFLRKVQTELQGDQATNRTLGVGIDVGLTSEEQLAASMPFVLLAVVGILVLVGALLRSYWAAALVGVGLAVTMLWYNAVLTLIGFEGGMLLGFIGPVSVIAFGVDFFVHASGRAREQQVAGLSRDESYPRGLTLVFPALLLAVISSAAAFISNGVAGIQAIVQFGVGTAIALVIGFAILGIIVPRWLLTIEESVGDPPLERGLMVLYKLGFLIMALFAGVVVSMSVGAPIIGVAALALFIPLFIYLPMRRTRAIYAKAASAGRPTGTVIKGAGHGFKAAGDVVHFLARWRVMTIPVTVVLAVLGAIAFTQVDSEFSFTDFFSEDSDAIQSLTLFEDHFGESSGIGSGFIYVEGDLTQPDALAAVANIVADLDAVEAAAVDDYLSRDLNGDVVLQQDNAVSIVQTAVAAPNEMEAAGIDVTDSDGDGFPDSAAAIAAIYDLAFADGITTDDGFLAYSADSVTELLWTDGSGTYATIAQVGIPSFTDDEIILNARAALDDVAATLQSSPAGAALAVVSVSGEAITNQNTLASFTDAMLLALPVALALCALLAAFFMRSPKYGVAAVVPILLVVGWVYGFMWWADYKINVVTATIAAIAVGVGIDFSTHFTMRFREEFEFEPSRFPALRRAGEGTGGALAVSALSSIIGFSVMAFAPMPIFVTFGTLTAVMIVFSLLVALLVLPSVLLVVTRSRTGAERQHFLDLTGIAPEDYRPHDRETALAGQDRHS
ncbi:MAG: efflux RND transporter permease subunit [Acidimicrobiales bacterium]